MQQCKDLGMPGFYDLLPDPVMDQCYLRKQSLQVHINILKVLNVSVDWPVSVHFVNIDGNILRYCKFRSVWHDGGM